MTGRGRVLAALLFLAPGAAWAHDDLTVQLDRLAAQAAHDTNARLEHAELSRLAGDSEAARADLDTLARIAPRLPGAFLLRAALASDDRRWNDAVREVDRFLAVSDGLPDDRIAGAFALRADAQAALGDTAGALADWDRAFASAHAPKADWALSRANLATAHGEDARPALERALVRLPGESSLTFLASDLDARNGDVDRAVARLDAFAQRCAQPASVIARTGDLYAQAGRQLDAEARWSDALERLAGDPRSAELAERLTGLLAGGRP